MGQHVDVITCHDYLPTRCHPGAYPQILDFCEAYRKPALLSEIGCPARNPYDVTLEICQEMGSAGICGS
ncbi:MAG: hypothetical protein U0703_09155 [Anaerolineae bacterium]